MEFPNESFEKTKSGAEILPEEMQAVADEIETILKEELQVPDGYMYSFDGVERTVMFPIPDEYVNHLDILMSKLETSTYSESYVFSVAANEEVSYLVMNEK